MKLGERAVNGRPGKVDSDTIVVGRYEGKFSKLTLVVEKNDIELVDFDVHFGNGDKWSPGVKHYFKDNSRSRVIDLPGDDRVIKSITLKYTNASAGRATVEVWAWKTEGAAAKPAGGGGKRHTWNNSGWQKLGERRVSGKADRDVISVGAYKGKFDKMQIIVNDSDLEMVEFVVTFGNGEKWEPKLRHYFKEGARSHILDVPGKDRVIKTINMAYKNLPGGGWAEVEVWAK